MENPFSKKQAQFLRTNLNDFNLVWGVTGSGKSYITNIKAYMYISQLNDGDLCLFSGNTIESLYDNVISPLCKMAPTTMRYASKNGRERLIYACHDKEVEISCIGANNERAQDRVQGKNVKLWLSDEIPKQPKSFVDMAISRLRSEENGRMKIMPAIFTLNPDSPSHYIKQEYLDKKRGDVNEWFFNFDDNPLIDKEYVEKQKDRFSGVFYERMILGKWTSAENAVYDLFNRSEHVTEEIPTKAITRYILGIDWGYEHPLALVLIGVTGDSEYYIIDEILKRKVLIDNSISNLVKILENRNQCRIETAYCDSARPEYIVQFRSYTGIHSLPAKKEIIEGIQCVQRLLKKRGNNRYGLQIKNGCNESVKAFENYEWAKDTSTGQERPKKVDDDMIDAIRYAIYTDYTLSRSKAVIL
jgi:PBSX family phage terminase large subunit